MNDGLFFFLTTIASTEGFLVASGLITAFLLARHGVRRGSMFLLTATGLMGAVIALKELFHVARPAGALLFTTGYAFPSGHAAGIAFLALTLCFLVRRAQGTVRYGVYAGAFLLALLIGASRIAYMVHTPFQVFAGFAIGIFFAWLFIRSVRTKRTHS